MFIFLECQVLRNIKRYICIVIKENRLYIEWNLLEKSVKRLFCCTVSILQVYLTYLCSLTFWALEHIFLEKEFLKIISFFLNPFSLTTFHAYVDRNQSNMCFCFITKHVTTIVACRLSKREIQYFRNTQNIKKWSDFFYTKIDGHKLNILNSYYTVGPIKLWRRRPKFEFVSCLLD